MLLADELKEFREKVLADMTPETLALMDEAISEISETGITRRCLTEGDSIPAFSLPNVHGEIVSSEYLLAKGPLVLNFYRGSW